MTQVTPVKEHAENTPTYLPSTWNLIQRLKPTDDWRRENKTKIDKYFNCDYMGSAEFEFGALPESIGLLRAMAAEGNLLLEDFGVAGPNKEVITWIICHKDSSFPDARKMLERLAAKDRTLYLKEPTYYDECFVKPRFERSIETHGWLVLDKQYPLFFFVEPNMAEEVFKELHSKPEKLHEVKAEELTMFQRVSFKKHDVTYTGSVVGIFDDHATVKIDLTNRRVEVSYTDLQVT